MEYHIALLYDDLIVNILSFLSHNERLQLRLVANRKRNGHNPKFKIASFLDHDVLWQQHYTYWAPRIELHYLTFNHYNITLLRDTASIVQLLKVEQSLKAQHDFRNKHDCAHS